LCKENKLIGYARINGQKMYQLQIEPIIEIVGYTYAKCTSDLNILHARLGHIGSERILKTQNCSIGLD
jgi:hypothetical protein